MTSVPRQRTFTGFDGNDDEDRKRPGPAAAADQTADLAGQTVYVVDAHSLIFQVFHALPEMTSPRGQPVGAIFGFVRDVFFLLEEKTPDYLLCAFDLPGDTFRHEISADYKAGREEMPEELRPQIAHIRRVLSALRVPILELESYEADDVVATIARQVAEAGGDCYVVSSDKDCRQLISDRVKLYNIRKDEVWDADTLFHAWGVRPDQVVDFQSLVGDPVDNVPGIPLIGPKIAGQLLQQYQTLEGVFENIDKITGTRRKENLAAGEARAFQSRRLVKLVDDLPLAIDWAQARPGRMDAADVAELFREFGFRTLLEKVQDQAASDAVHDEWVTHYQAVTSIDQLTALCAQLASMPRIAVDTETTSVSPRCAELVGISVAWESGQAAYIPLRAPPGEPRLDADAAFAELGPLLEDPALAKVGQNLKYDRIVLRRAGIALRGIAFDTMIASYLLDAGSRNHGLDELSRRYLQHDTIKIDSLIGSGRHAERMDEVPLEAIAAYAGEDADVALRLADILAAQLADQGLVVLFDDLEMPLVDVLAEMEFNGIRVSRERLNDLSRTYGRRLADLEADIYRLAGREFNIGSPKQLAQILFDEMNLPVLKRTKTGKSTDIEVLEQLAAVHELPAKIIEYRQFSKLKSTYVDALPELIKPETGRVHTSFNQVVAATGRLSSMEPNLQNIPVRTETSREIRSAFLPAADDWTLLAADYSQIELRVLAHYSKDETLAAAFAANEDIHTRVASEVFGVPLAEVSREMRRRAKAVNFGVIYGQSAFGLAKSLGIDKGEAAAFIEAYFQRYARIGAFMDEVLEECRRNRYVKTISGRRRQIDGVRPPEKRRSSRQMNLPERTAINTVIQGSAADLIKQAMISIYRRLQRDQHPSRMLLQIHDELLFEVPTPQVRQLSQLVREEMESVGDLSVPLQVDIKAGANWAECELLDA